MKEYYGKHYEAIVASVLGPPRRTLHEVGEEFGISRERVRQILLEHGPGPLKVTRAEIRRFMRAVAYVAKIEQRRLEHGTLRRYRGYMKELPPCRCERCKEANRKHTYGQLGYTPKMTRPEYDLNRRLGTYKMKRGGE